MPASSFYPNVASLVSVTDLPEELQFLEQGLQYVLDNLYYKQLYFTKSKDGSNAYYELVLVANEPLAINILSSGFSLILNPGSNSTETLIPLTLRYSWPILRLIKTFKLESFSFTPSEILNIFNLAVSADNNQLIDIAIHTFEEIQDDEIEDSYTYSAYAAFVDKINFFYNLTGTSQIPYPPEYFESFDVVEDLIRSIHDNVTITDSIQEIIINIYINSEEDAVNLDKLNNFCHSFIGMPIETYIKNLIIPFIEATLDLSVGLAIPRNILTPLTAPVAIGGEELPEPEQAILVFDIGTLDFSSRGGIGFSETLDLTLNHPCQIGKTGLGIEFTHAKLDLSKNSNITEADQDGRPDSFVGVFIEKVAITLPSKWFTNVGSEGSTLQISGYSMLIGTGGISGTIALETLNSTATSEDDYLIANLGNWQLGFSYFDMVFKQNKVESSHIQGKLTIPKFVYPNTTTPVTILINGQLDDDGDFKLTASAQPPYPIQIKDVFTYQVKSVELGKDNDDFYIGTSGTLQFEGFLKDTLNLGAIEIERLRIYSDGSFEFIGGSVQLIEPVVLPLGPIDITVSAIHYGSIQKEVDGIIRKFNYFGFDGGVKVDPFGIEVRGDGVKYFYCVDDVDGYPKPKPFLRIQTLHLDLTLPADSGKLAEISGWINIPDPGISREYAGEISLKIPSVNIAGKAGIKLAPRYPAFIIDAEIEPSIPITLGSFAIYGFRGLLGYRYVAEKEAVGLVSGVNTWYEYYKYPKRGINIQKFSGPERTAGYSTPISLGAGATLGTGYDEGYTLSIKAMALFSIPSLFMIDGRAAILAKRLGLDESSDPPFFAFVAVGDNSLEFGFGADYKLPGNGNIISLYADVQAGFFFKNQKPWYVNIGTNINPITARIITLLTIKSYVMLSARGIEAGARGEFNFDRDYGVIKVKAHAFVEIGGRISFEKPQFGSYLMAGVGASVRVLFVSLGLEVGILFGVEAPKPFLIYGKFYFTVKVGIKIFGKRITLFKFSGNLEVTWNFNKNIDRDRINPLLYNGNTPNALQGIVEGINMLSGESFALKYLNTIPEENSVPEEILQYVIPLDTYIDIKTEKGLLPGNVADPESSVRKLLGGINNAPSQYQDLIPPVSSIRGREIRQVKHEYSIEDIQIKFFNTTKSKWENYHPYEALYPDPTDPNILNMKIGHFQKSDGQYNAIRLMATTPFSYTEQGQPGWYVPERYGITASTLFCEAEHREKHCADFLEKVLNTRYLCNNPNTPLFTNNVAIQLNTSNEEDYTYITDKSNVFGFAKSLAFENKNSIELLLPQPSVMASLKVSNYTMGVRVKFYSVINNIGNDPLFNVVYGNPNPDYYNSSAPYELIVTGASLEQEIRYNHYANDVGEWQVQHANWRPISKIVIEPIYDTSVLQRVAQLNEQIAVIENDNNLINLGLIDGEIRSTAPLEEQVHELECGTAGNSVSFVNRYRKKDLLNYYYSKEFTEDGKQYVYAVGTTEKLGLITKVAADGEPVWEKTYTLGEDRGKFIIKRIIQVPVNIDDERKVQYILHGTTGDIHYLLSIDPVKGDVNWSKQIQWDDNHIQIHFAPSTKQPYFFLILSDRNDFDTDKKPLVSKIDFSGNFIDGVVLAIPKEEFIINSVCETSTGIALAGRYIEGKYWDSVGTVIELDNDLKITASFKIDKYYTAIHDIELIERDKYLVSGYDSKEDGLFVCAVSKEGQYASYHFPDTKNHRSVIQVTDEGYYLLSNDDQNGVLHLLSKSFVPQWSKEINIGGLSNGIRNFTINPLSGFIVLNCYNLQRGSILVRTNKHLHSCQANVFDNPILGMIDFPIREISIKPEKREAGLKEWPVSINDISSQIDKYCPGGGCGEKDDEVCGLRDNISVIYLNELVEPAIVSSAYFKDAAVSFGKITSEVRKFNPKYELAKKLEAPLSHIDRFIEKQDLANYTLAWDAVRPIRGQLLQIGHCTCECEADEITMLHQVCWMSMEDYTYNINIPSQEAIQADAQATIDGITQYIQPIWRPDTSYYIHFVLRDKVDNTETLPYSFTYGFRTQGPVGFFHTADNSTYGDIKLNIGDMLLGEDDQYLKVVDGGLQLSNGSLYLPTSNDLTLEDTTGLIRDNATGQLLKRPDFPNNPNALLRVIAHPENYALTSLKPYIDYKRSYPNADGNLLSAKPLFYNDDQATQIMLFFNNAYVTHFFKSWESYKPAVGQENALAGRLKVVIKDPVEGIEIVNPPYLDYDENDIIYSHIPQSEESWSPDDNPQVPFEIRNYLNLYNAPNCIGDIAIIKPASEYVTIFPKHLKPNKLYTVIVNNLYDVNHNGTFDDSAAIEETREVHSFVFKTSRYRNFREQIESFHLRQEIDGQVAERDAIFKYEKEFTALQINAARAVINGQPITGFDQQTLANLELNYQHAYDKIFEGILGFKPWNEPICTEVNLIKDISTGNTVAIIIRNPEPFNDPKIPVQNMYDTIEVIDQGLYNLLFSKDYSQVVIMKVEGAIPEGIINLKFIYKLWNGFTYNPFGEPSILTINTQIN